MLKNLPNAKIHVFVRYQTDGVVDHLGLKKVSAYVTGDDCVNRSCSFAGQVRMADNNRM